MKTGWPALRWGFLLAYSLVEPDAEAKRYPEDRDMVSSRSTLLAVLGHRCKPFDTSNNKAVAQLRL